MTSTQPSTLPREQRAQTRLQYGRDEVRSMAQREPDRYRKRDHPLSIRRARQHVVDEVGGGVLGAARRARRADAAALARKRHEQRMAARARYVGAANPSRHARSSGSHVRAVRRRSRAVPPPGRRTTGPTGGTHSAAAIMRRPMHDGQKPRPLHEKGTRSCSPHRRHAASKRPRPKSPQVTKASAWDSLSACLMCPISPWWKSDRTCGNHAGRQPRGAATTRVRVTSSSRSSARAGRRTIARR